LITSTLLTMIALPLLFEIFNNVTGIQLWPLKFIRKTKPLVTALILLTFSVATYGQTKQLSLEDAILMAMQNNKEINAYSLKVKEVEALKPTAFSIDKTHIYYGYDQNNVAENGYPLYVFGLQQNFNFPTVYTAQNKANSITISIAGKELMRAKQLLARDVSQEYYHIIYLLNRQAAYLKIDSLYQSFTPMMERKLEKGDISRLDLLNTKAKQHQIGEIINQIILNLATANEKFKALVQSDSAFEVPLQNLDLVQVKEIVPDTTAGIQLMKMQNEYTNATLKVERNRLFPDLTLNYFNGTNSNEGSKNYSGFQLGMSVPLFFGEQNAKIKANKIAINLNESQQINELIMLKARHAGLENELSKCEEAIEFYHTIGKNLSDEIIHSSQRSYEIGEIDFFQFVMSIENAIALKLDYYENVAKYNSAALEINYLTK